MPPYFFHHFTKENNFSDFLFASLNKQALSNLSLLLEEQILSFRIQLELRRKAIRPEKNTS